MIAGGAGGGVFVVNAYPTYASTDTDTAFVSSTSGTASALSVGPNPLAEIDPAGLRGVDAGNRWTVDFEQAVTKGMAVPYLN